MIELEIKYGATWQNPRTGKILSVQKVPNKKRYQLLVSLGLSCYSLASFNSDECAEEFIQFMKEEISGFNNENS